ncbi:uncharacterized protein LOC131614136 [Vicia villosa]|uniref:uncharacterized protein LOC131614136 n=1 Tax=Vicia villosa TaxID=3911 RepID=UPI00273C0583|nr:uncharacterized protein LOC131614136 [Vicia villosa]
MEEYRGFQVGDNNIVDILHFANDTIILGNGDIHDLWGLKSILRGFELMSGLKVNFGKSSILGVNLSSRIIAMSSAFLNCVIGVMPFKFLGVMVGGNPRKVGMWKDVLNDVRRRLDKWRGRFLSMGGRVTLINSILNSIPIYSLSFYHAPKKVLSEIRRIQRRFLWGVVDGGNRIN